MKQSQCCYSVEVFPANHTSKLTDCPPYEFSSWKCSGMSRSASTGRPSPINVPSLLFLAGSLVFGFSAAANGDGVAMVASWLFTAGSLVSLCGGGRS